MVLEAKTNA